MTIQDSGSNVQPAFSYVPDAKVDGFHSTFVSSAPAIESPQGTIDDAPIVIANTIVGHTSSPTETKLYKKTSYPPRNCHDFGQWGTVVYRGTKTGALAFAGFLACGVPGLFILGCPQDSKDGYRVNGVVYDAGGKALGSTYGVRFIPSRHP